MVTEELAGRMVATSGDYSPDVSEFQVANLTPVASELVAPPRVAESPINLETRCRQILALQGSSSKLVIGEIVRWHVADEFIAEDGLVDTARLRPIGRLGRNQYVKFGEVFAIDRPHSVRSPPESLTPQTPAAPRR